MTFRPPRTWRGRVRTTDLNREVRDQFRELRDALSALEASGGGGGATIPVGMILPSARGDVPSGYLVCDGQSALIGTYPDLYDICGSAYGSPTATTFVLPDMTSRF
ncbi:MAG: phage tail protein, partial [Ilumatobacteraceae bacterium]